MQRMLSTSDLASALGISESSVRRLADSGDLAIHRTSGGHRRIPVEEAVRFVRDAGVSVARPDVLGLVNVATNDSGRPEAEQLLDALRGGWGRNVIEAMRSIYASGRSIAQLCDGPIRDAMMEIGDSWPADKRSIFVEHRATLLCVRGLCQLRLDVPDPKPGAPTAMGGAPSDDPYLLPSLMASLVLQDCGYSETNLGPNTPLDVLTDSVEDEKPRLVWLALSNPIRSRHQAREIDRLAATVQKYGGTMLIGGKSSRTYDGAIAERCSCMVELCRKAKSLAAA